VKSIFSRRERGESKETCGELKIVMKAMARDAKRVTFLRVLYFVFCILCFCVYSEINIFY
jgi:hypothetical protein